jgi:chorismate--pyruvate lyase
MLDTPPPTSLGRWLQDSRSLTRRLQKKSRGQFSVSVLKQGWEKPRLEETQALGIPPHQLALVREVVLHGNGQAWVYARSVIPSAALNGELRFLRKLGNKPLGALLFGNRSIRREPVVLQRVAQSRLPVTLQQPGYPPLHGRYSIFRHGKNGILVSEVFLPDFVASLVG